MSILEGKKFAFAAVFGMVFCAFAVEKASAGLTTYTDEASYLAAIASYSTISEGFEGSDWIPAQGTGASSITSQGLKWSASDNVRVGSGWARTGGFGVFDSFGAPDQIFAMDGTNTLYGVGGWFTNSTAPSLTIALDGNPAFSFNLSGSHQFFGVVETNGFNDVSFAAPSGHWGADDFTIASAVPEPSSYIIWSGVIGIGAFLRRRKMNS